MEELHVHQSLPICIALASIGGILEVAATALTALPSVREKQGIFVSPLFRWMAVFGNIFLQMLGGIFSALLATWFGPVSIVVPFYYCATLLTNMIVFGLFLGEPFKKPMRVGTHVIVLAVILLPVVGPTISPDQTFAILMQHWYSILWFLLLVVTTLVTGAILVFKASPTNTDPETNLFLKEYTQIQRTIVLLLCRAATMSVDLTVSRFLILSPPSKAVMGALIVTKLWSGNLCTYCIVVQSYSVQQARYVPLNATMVILVNALTGILVWEDQPQSWYGYLCVFWLLGIGCDLLLSVPLLTPENLEFGTTKSASLIITEGRRKLTGDPEEIKKLLFDAGNRGSDSEANQDLKQEETATNIMQHNDNNGGNTDGRTTPKRKGGTGYQSIANNNGSNEDGSLAVISRHLHYTNAAYDETNDGAAWDMGDYPTSPLTTTAPAMARAASPLDFLSWNISHSITSPDATSSHASNSTTMSSREAWSEVISPNKSSSNHKRQRTFSWTTAGTSAAPEAYFHNTTPSVVRHLQMPSPPTLPADAATAGNMDEENLLPSSSSSSSLNHKRQK
ncbi:unnamed protein product [Cylindrotheca closterium]|uniref:Magnesium transporter n=1 Tax=Cylindrotheca closterium TaxID=2856 RepID=A0AAD2FTY5_9STRA|nr:unnamed protein product [Cylindrotheca closterium]